MKVNKIFHWLYFLVLLLPIFAIPVFMIYSHRHQIDNYQVEVQENKVVDFNQLVNINTINGTYDNDSVNITTSNNYYNINVVGNRTSKVSFAVFDLELKSSDIYIVKINGDNIESLFGYNNGLGIYYSFANFGGYGLFNYGETRRQFSVDGVTSVNLEIGTSLTTGSYSVRCQIFNLTQMFGVGYEPTLQEFNAWYSNDYYDYTLSHIELLKDYQTITYNDTDIGSQYLYSLYDVVNNYFNYDDAFNFVSLYDWLQLNVFSGSAPLGFFVFWHLLIYWLLTSLLWLLFDVLLYVPKLIHKWIDKADIS